MGMLKNFFRRFAVLRAVSTSPRTRLSLIQVGRTDKKSKEKPTPIAEWV